MKYPNLEAELARKGIKKRQLAANIGMRPTTLSIKMHGKSDFTLPELKRIKHVLEVNMPLEVLFDYLPTEQKEGEGA